MNIIASKMSTSTAKITRQPTGPEMTDYLDAEIYELCEAIRDSGKKGSEGIASIRFIELFKVSCLSKFEPCLVN